MMKVIRKLTDEEADQLARLRGRGWSYARIGERMGRSASSIMYHCLSQGIVSPRQRWEDPPAEPTEHVGFGGRTRRFTASEDAEMLRLEAEGLSSDTIAERIGRARSSVRMRLLRLGLRDELPA